MVDNAIAGTTDLTGIETNQLMFSIQQIKNIDYTNAGGHIASSVEKSTNLYVDAFFFGYYLYILSLVAIILALPVIEMLFYHLIWKTYKTPNK